MKQDDNGTVDTLRPAVDIKDDEAWESVEMPYQLLALRQAVILNVTALNGLATAVSDLRVNLETRDATVERRIKMVADLAAEECASRMSSKLLRDLMTVQQRVTRVEKRVEDVDKTAETAEKRASNASLEAAAAKGAAEASGKWAAQIAKGGDSDPPEPKAVRRWRKRMAIAAVVLAGIATGIGAAVQAYRESLRPAEHLNEPPKLPPRLEPPTTPGKAYPEGL